MTQNSWNSDVPVSVSKGGTGASTLTGVVTGNGTSAMTANTITQYGVLIGGASNAVSSTAVGTAGQVLTSNGAGSDPTYQDNSVSGKIVQYIISTSSTAGTTTNNIPYDGSIPQNTEGAEVMTATITPTNSSNQLVIDCRIAYDASAASIPAIALFQDSTANALVAGPLIHNSNQAPAHGVLVHTMAAGTASSTTFKIRGGPQVNGSQTFYWNRSVSFNPLYGSARFMSTIIIYELEV